MVYYLKSHSFKEMNTKTLTTQTWFKSPDRYHGHTISYCTKYPVVPNDKKKTRQKTY